MALEMKYFVLKPSGDDVFADASRKALLAYAKVIEDAEATLADDLRLWATREAVSAASRKLAEDTAP